MASLDDGLRPVEAAVGGGISSNRIEANKSDAKSLPLLDGVIGARVGRSSSSGDADGSAVVGDVSGLGVDFGIGVDVVFVAILGIAESAADEGWGIGLAAGLWEALDLGVDVISLGLGGSTEKISSSSEIVEELFTAGAAGAAGASRSSQLASSFFDAAIPGTFTLCSHLGQTSR